MFKTWEQMSRKEQLASDHYDFYKDVHGIRPRWMNYEVMTEAELELEISLLAKEAEIVWANEARQQDLAETEAMARINSLLAIGAKDLQMAIGWLHDAEGTNGDNEYLDFHLGTRYGFIQKLVDSVAV